MYKDLVKRLRGIRSDLLNEAADAIVDLENRNSSLEAINADLEEKSGYVKYGEWKHVNIWSDYECSICHEYSDHMSPFCPNCGADMRGKNNGKI